MKKTTVRELYELSLDGKLVEGEEIEVSGWIRTNRDSGSIGFIELHDGTVFKGVQIVYLEGRFSKLKTAAAIVVRGKIALTPEAKQPFEIKSDDIDLVGDVDEDYPLQKKRASFEFLRENAHLRPRTNTFQALYRVRSVLAMNIHRYFQDRGFVYVHTPEITANDAEGAGQAFSVVTDAKDIYKDFFGRKASLTVSGQLHVEAFALAFKDVYTFGPTFRAEKSNTPRHAAEFWMIEPEIAFAHLDDDMALIEDFLKYLIRETLERCPDEMAFFDKFIQPGLIEKLKKVEASPFKKMTYTEAVEVLKKAKEGGHKFEYSDIRWGMDLQSEHERYLTEEIVQGPLFLIDYPKEIKAFYMKENDDGKTVAACDLLVPGEGEIVGGSERETRPEILKAKMEKLGNLEGLEWYYNLRRFGGCPHAGFGLGFDRFLMYITGMTNIRDTEPYPRTFNQLKY